MRRVSHLVCLGALVALSLILFACGGSSTPTTTAATLGSIKIDPASATIGVTQQVTFTPTLRDSNGALISGYALGWASSNSNVVSVNGAGVATGISAGTATITATGNAPATTSKGTATVITSNAATVTVIADVASVTVSPPTATTTVGSTAQFTAVAKDAQGNTLSGIQFAWSSSNALVATVDNTGLATGRAKGTATIVATAGSVQSNLATLTVN